MNTASKKDKALSKVLFMGKFNLTENMLEEGLHNGEFYMVKDEQGKEKYSWESLEHKRETGTASRLSLGAHKQLSASEAKLEKEAFASGKTPQGLFGPGLSAKALPASAKSIPIEDQKKDTLTEKQWEQAQGQLTEAMQAFDKMAKEIKKQLGILGHDEKDDPVYISLHLGLL